MVLGTGLFFGLAHILGQGFYGALQATLIGWLFGTIYFLNGQRLWFLMITHAAFDVAAVWIIYFGLEERIAHSVFGSL
jgi:membrane protease YdiL (CAAX protease family)